MGYIGDLEVRLGINTKDLTKGIKQATTELANVGKSAGESINQAFSTNGTDKINQDLKQVTSNLDQVQQSARRTGQILREFIRSVKMPKLPAGGAQMFGDVSELQKSYQTVLEFIAGLTRMGLITQQTSSRFREFSNNLFDFGFSVDYIIQSLQRYVVAIQASLAATAAMISMMKNMQTTQQSSTPQLGGGSGGSGSGGGGGNNNNNTPAMLPSPQSGGSNPFGSVKQAIDGLSSSWGTFKQRGVSAFREVNKWANSLAKSAQQNQKDWKSVARIVQGIMISQAFYKILSSIKQSISALKEFIITIEQVKVALGTMLGDNLKADRLTKVLEDFSADTNLSFEQAAQGARKLLTYGFEAENLIPIMKALTDATSASGDAETFTRIAKAMGQIQTKGRLAQQELLQLTEAGIPAVKILEEELGLTREQLANIGKYKIPADVAINAILKGMNKRYSGASDAMANTWGVIASNIFDNVKIIGEEAFGGVFESVKNAAKNILNVLTTLREQVRQFGIAGAIQNLVSPETFEQIQILVANFKMLFETLRMFMSAWGPVIREFARFGMYAMNLVLPPLNAILRILTMLLQAITSNAQAMRIFSAVIGTLVFITTIVKLITLLRSAIASLMIAKVVAGAIRLLSKACLMFATLWATHPILAVLLGVSAALLGIAAVSKGASGALSKVQQSILGAFGHNPTDDFAAKQEDNAVQTDEFNKELNVSKDSLDEVGKSADKTNKKVKNMLTSFDEVFTLQDPSADKQDEDLNVGDWDDLTVPSIPEVDIDPIDWDEWANEDGLNNVWDSIKSIFAGLGKYFTSDYWRGLMTGSPWDPLFEGVADVIDGVEQAFNGLAEFLAGFIVGDLGMIGSGWQNFWKGCGEIVHGLVGIVDGAFDGIMSLLDQFLGWLGGEFYTMFKDCFAGCGADVVQMKDGIIQTLHGLTDFLFGFISGDMQQFSYGWWQIINGIGEFMKGFVNLIFDILGGLVDYLLGDFLRNFGWLGTSLAAVLDSLKEAIKAIIGNIKGIFGGLIDFIAGVFTGDWKRALEGLKTAFLNILGGIGNIFIGIMNTIIDAVNWVIRKINTIGFDIPDFLGGGHVGFEMDEFTRIPYFEKGGLVTRDTIARIGEKNKAEGILPLTDSRAMAAIGSVIAANTPRGGGQGEGTYNGPIVELTVNGPLIADERSIRQLKQMLDEAGEKIKRGRRS